MSMGRDDSRFVQIPWNVCLRNREQRFRLRFERNCQTFGAVLELRVYEVR